MVVESYSQEILQEGEAELAAPPEEAVIISDNSEFIVKVSLNAACVSHDTTRTDAERHAWTTGVLVSTKALGPAGKVMVLLSGCFCDLGYAWYCNPSVLEQAELVWPCALIYAVCEVQNLHTV